MKNRNTIRKIFIILNVLALIFGSCGGETTNKQISKMKNTMNKIWF